MILWKASGRLFTLAKALAAGERWITVRPNGPGTEGQPLLIKPAGDGSMKVIGGAGGKLNHLRLTGVRSESDYKQEAAQRAKAHREARKRQTELDKRDGLHANKSAARAAVRAQLSDQEAKFIQEVARALNWKDEHLRFPEKKFAGLSPAAQKKAAERHASALVQRAHDAVEQHRQRLVQEAEQRSEINLGEIPLTTDKPDQLSVQDIAPVDGATKGLGFVPNYGARAEANGFDPQAAKAEAEEYKPPPEHPRPEGAPAPWQVRKVTSEAIADELKTVREPPPKLDTDAEISPKTVLELMRAQKALRAAKRTATEQNRKIDAAKAPVEPNAYVIEVAGVAPDKSVTADLENDLRTLRTRAFLDEVGKVGNQVALGRHIGVGAYNSVNALSLAAGGAALLDRSAVDVLGIAGAAQVLARRLASDLTPAELEHVKAAMGSFHVDHYMGLSTQALREARDWQEMAQEIELGAAANAADLQAAQELNARRREFIANAERALGTALGEMEANAALVVALEQPKKQQIEISLGKLSLEQAIVRLRALGLGRGDYQLERIGPSTMLTVTGSGMDKLAQPVAREDLQRTRTALDIIEGRKDQDDWLPAGVTRRPEAAMNAPPGVAPRLARPFTVGERGVTGAVEDYIGGRAADGDTPAEIMAGLLSEDTLARSGDRTGLMRAINAISPLYDADGKLVRAEDYAGRFAELADAFIEREHGGQLAPIHKQQFQVDQVAVDALHQALAKHPDGVAAFKPIADLSAQDQAALRGVFAREYGRKDQAAEEMRVELEKLNAAEPAREVQDMFGRGPNPEHADWRAKRDELAEKLNNASMTWAKYLSVMGSPANAYRAMQDVVRSDVLREFAMAHNRAKPKQPLKLGRTVIAHDLNHLDALDPVAREKRLAEHRKLADSLRNRTAGRYAAGSVADKIDAARAHEAAFEQSQMGLFGTEPDESDEPTPEKPVPLGERHTIGHAAERQVASMMPIVGANFRPGQPVKLWSPTMSGKYVGRQRAVKHIRAMKRTVLGMGVGSGKTAISLSAFTDAHAAGEAKRGLFAVPSIVQGQFHGEALTLLEPGKYRWHAAPGASQDERIAAYKNPDVHFSVVTHQALRDDLLHLASHREGTTPEAVAQKMDAMTPIERRDYMRGVLDAEGIDHDFLAVDEGHNLLNREGKANSRMANVIDAVGHGMRTHVSMTADPVKNDPSEAFDVLAKMDPVRYSDRDAFLRRYGVNTPASREALRREMARHFYTGNIDPGVKVERKEVAVDLTPEQHTELARIDGAAATARLARLRGGVDVDALRTLSPSSFEGVNQEQQAEVASKLSQSIGILHNMAAHKAVSGESKTEALARIADERRGKQGVVFTHHLHRVQEIADRLKADGHSVVTLTGADSAKDKDRKKREYQTGKHDIIILSDAGAVGANLQNGKWLVQDDTPMTAMVHAQRQGRIHRIGQTDDVELLDLVANHPIERRARKRLANKYELRSIMTSALDGLDDTGLAGYLNRARTGKAEALSKPHAPTPDDLAPVKPGDQSSLL